MSGSDYMSRDEFVALLEKEGNSEIDMRSQVTRMQEGVEQGNFKMLHPTEYGRYIAFDGGVAAKMPDEFAKYDLKPFSSIASAFNEKAAVTPTEPTPDIALTQKTTQPAAAPTERMPGMTMDFKPTGDA